MGIRFRTCLTWYLAAAMLVIGVVPRAYAGFSPSEIIGISPAEKEADLQKLQKFLEMKIVRERLKECGFAAGEIQARLDGLSELQLHQLASKADELQVGGDGAGVLIALVAIALLVVVLVLLLQHRVIVK